jgi:hypothetical protein
MRIAEQRFERPQPGDLVEDLFDQPLASRGVQLDLLLLDDLGDRVADLVLEYRFFRDLAQRCKVNVLHDLTVEIDLHLVERRKPFRLNPAGEGALLFCLGSSAVVLTALRAAGIVIAERRCKAEAFPQTHLMPPSFCGRGIAISYWIPCRHPTAG